MPSALLYANEFVNDLCYPLQTSLLTEDGRTYVNKLIIITAAKQQTILLWLPADDVKKKKNG